MAPCGRQSDKKRYVLSFLDARSCSNTEHYEQVNFDGELLMMPKDKDVQVVLVDAL
jgi:hypothetical protein